LERTNQSLPDTGRLDLRWFGRLTDVGHTLQYVSAFGDRVRDVLAVGLLSPQARSQHRNVLLVGTVAILVAWLNLTLGASRLSTST
jgi:hypothetical protein